VIVETILEDAVKLTRTIGTLLAIAALPLIGCAADDEVAEGAEFATAGPALKYDSWEVLATNPVCKEYVYGEDVFSVAGEKIAAKPVNVFCSSKNDSGPSGSRPESPQYRLIEWIKDPSTTEIFFTYLSFSNSKVQTELCNAIKERSVKVTFVLDSGSDTVKADALMACQPGDGKPEHMPRFEKRGHTPGIGYAHNKIFMVNPTSDTIKFAFGSGNMSSGVVLHHENWHFITLPAATHFAQAHLCVMQAELDHYQSAKEFKAFLKTCRAAIPYPEERDAQVWFAPAEGSRASKALTDAIAKAESIDIAAHRFSYTTMINAIMKELDGWEPPAVRIVTDDDTFWAGQDEIVGDNQPFEFYKIKSLTNRGAEVKWMETNHFEHLLHHNKFLVFDMPEGTPDAFFGGAGNLTGTAFGENWENFYYVTIPEVVEKMRTQYEHLYTDLATSPDNMPEKNVQPMME
jgi:phospholipase D-like protein